ncbi:MAG: trigger factor [Phycisphaeraceae bacterium]|nr:trigger factor [Phycisphaeraceae bacterium]
MAPHDHEHHHDHDHDHDHNHDHDHAGPLSVSVQDVGPARKCLTIEIPAERIAEQVGSRFEELQSQAALPGFRPGKAPKRLLQRRFTSAVRDEVRTQLLSDCYSQAIEQEKLNVLGQPEIKDLDTIKLPESGPLTFKVEVEVVPAFELPSLDGVAIKRPKLELTDAEVEAEIERMGRQFGSLSDAGDAAIEVDDYLMTEVTILAGQDAPDSAEQIAHHPQIYVLVPGESRSFKGHVAGIVVDDLGKRLLGQKAGQMIRVSQIGPSAHENEKIKDQPITLVIKIQKVERVAPAAETDLAARFGAADPADLRKQVRTMLESRHQRQQQSAMHQQLCDYLVEKVEMELPEGLSGRQAARMLQRQAMELAYQGLGDEEIAQRVAELRQSSDAEARRTLKLFFILSRAAETLEVEVSEGELNGRIAMYAMQQGRRPEKLRQEMQRSGQLEQLYMQIRDQKTLDKVLEKASITDVDPSELAEDGKDAAKAEKKTEKKSTKKSTKK